MSLNLDLVYFKNISLFVALIEKYYTYYYSYFQLFELFRFENYLFDIYFEIYTYIERQI